ncbi:BLUF domain-containing protein [Marinoscillum sp.]|uniref:BLUF domain-containing protein n=1 Tax=Marinoscillum sp. TaxID=2024838 RepID=UPI003BAC5421
MNQNLYFLVYVSYSARELNDAAMEQLLHVARHYNKSNDISGLLLHYNDRFIQVLEGPKESVQKLYAKIQKDKRHHSPTVVFEGPIQSRIFKNWSMGYEKVNEKNDLISEDITLLQQLFDGDHSSHPIVRIMSRFYEKNINIDG